MSASPSRKRLELIVRKTLVAMISLVGLLMTSCGTGNFEYPSRKMELIVGYGAGSANDTIARSYAAALEEVSGATVLVVNRPGAGGIISATEAMLAPADGYSLLLAPISAFTTAPLMQEVHYSPEDFRTVAALAEQPFAITVAADSPYNSLEDLGQETSLTAAILGEGHASQVVIGTIMQQLGSQIRSVPFDGSGAVLQSVISGETDVAVTDANTAYQRVRSGELKALAVTGSKPMDAFPGVRTVSEAGFPEADYMVTQALAVPVDTPEEIVDKLEKLSDQAVATDTYQDFLAATNTFTPDMEGREWMDTYAPSEMERLRKAYAELGIGPNE